MPRRDLISHKHRDVCASTQTMGEHPPLLPPATNPHCPSQSQQQLSKPASAKFLHATPSDGLLHPASFHPSTNALLIVSQQHLIKLNELDKMGCFFKLEIYCLFSRKNQRYRIRIWITSLHQCQPQRTHTLQLQHSPSLSSRPTSHLCCCFSPSAV